MNNTRLRFYFKILIFTTLFFLACGFQTSFWPNVISFMPSPQIWLILIVFITIKWKPVFTIFYIYFLGFCLTRFSEVPLKMVWVCLLMMFTALWFIKNRIQLTGALSFIVLTLIGSAIFELSYYYFSDLLEMTPTPFMFFDRILQILINFIFCYPIYFVLTKIDNVILDQDEWQKSRSHHEVAQHE